VGVLYLKRIEPRFRVLISKVEIDIVFWPYATGASGILNFAHNVIANFDSASGSCLSRG